MVYSRGESFSHRTNQMKLLNAIAAAAAICASFCVPNPVEARNAWKSHGDNYYSKPAGGSSNICNGNINADGNHY